MLYGNFTFPGVAQLVGRLLWEQEAARSSRATRTMGKSFQVLPFLF